MSKYDTYDNSLTRYIDLIMNHPIKDIVGDIVGDVLDVDIPINYLDGDQTIEAETSLGHMTIKVTKLFTKDILTFSRKIGGSIYEEYRLEIDALPVDFLVYGSILEEREKGVILTNIIRYYDYCNHDDIDKRLVSSEETRTVFDNDQLVEILPHTHLQGLNIEQKYNALKNLIDLSRMKRNYPLVNTSISLRIPHYIGANYRRGEFPHRHAITINNQSSILLYEFIEGNKTLERVKDLLYGSITSRSINDFKTMVDYTMCDGSKAYIYGFNRLANTQISTDGEVKRGKLQSIESDLIGPSLVTMSKEYYEYLRELILGAFNVKLDGAITPDNVVELIKKDYTRDYRGNPNETNK